MKVHLVEPKILLLQSIRNRREFSGEQRSQVASLAADHDSDFVGTDYSVDFHAAEGRSVHADVHFRLCGFADHLRHLHWACRRSNRSFARSRQT